MATLTLDAVYSVRFGPKLPLPQLVQDTIARLRITSVPYRPVRTFVRHNYRNRGPATPQLDNWRQAALVDIVRKVKEREDPEYSEIFGIFNKISPGNLDRLSGDAIVFMQKRDEQFRLRVSALLFDRAITQPSFSTIMAECAWRINEIIPGVSEDLQSQVEMFPKLYDMTETVVFPDAGDAHFADKVVVWMKQKEKRRGYAKFMMDLFAKNLISEDVVQHALDQVLRELNDTARQKSSEQTTENTTHFVDFIFELSKKVRGSLRDHIKTSVQEVLATPKPELPSLNMRSKFKLEDAFKELNKKD